MNGETGQMGRKYIIACAAISRSNSLETTDGSQHGCRLRNPQVKRLSVGVGVTQRASANGLPAVAVRHVLGNPLGSRFAHTLRFAHQDAFGLS